MKEENNADFKLDGTVIDSDEQLLDIMNGGSVEEEEQENSPESSQDDKEQEEEESPSSQGEDDSEGENSKEEEEPEEKSKNDDEEDNIPFHKHPRFKEIISEKNELKSKLEEKDKDYSDLKSRLDNLENSKKSLDEVSPEFVKLFGDNKEAYDTWKSMTVKEQTSLSKNPEFIGILKDEIKKEMKAEEEKEQKLIQEAQEYVESQITSLKEKGEKFDEKKLKEVMAKYQPGEGDSLDFEKGLEIYRVLEKSSKKTKSNRKAIADMTNSSSGEEKEAEYYTPGFSRRIGN